MKLHIYKISILLFVAIISFQSCKKDYESIEEIDTQEIQNYFSQNNLTGFSDTLGIKYKIIKQGTGALLKYDSIVPIIFTVRSLDGKYSLTDTFAPSNRYGAIGGSSSYSGTISSEYLGYFGAEKGYPDVIKKSVKDILKRSGGEIRMIIPSRLAYGRSGYGDIPGNTSLDYSIKVLDLTHVDQYDELAIQKYAAANSLTGFSKTPEGVWYKVLTAGTGSPITVDSTITVEYTGKLFNGTVFDQTTDGNTATFVLSEVIPGWQKTVPFIKEGGTIRLLIPSSMAYGRYGSREQLYGSVTIPPVSCLDFEIKVTGVAITSE